MTAQSATGRGPGASRTKTTKELAILSDAPAIIFSGFVAADVASMSSPPVENAEVTFPYPLPGAANDYVIILTTLNGGSAYVTGRTTADNTLLGFHLVAEAECDVMYIVAKAGVRPNI